MPGATVFTFELDHDLHEAFLAAAASVEQPASQLVRNFMRAYVAERQDEPEHDAWSRAEIECGVREADDPAVLCVPYDDVVAEWHAQRAELLKQGG